MTRMNPLFCLGIPLNSSDISKIYRGFGRLTSVELAKLGFHVLAGVFVEDVRDEKFYCVFVVVLAVLVIRCDNNSHIVIVWSPSHP